MGFLYTFHAAAPPITSAAITSRDAHKSWEALLGEKVSAPLPLTWHATLQNSVIPTQLAQRSGARVGEVAVVGADRHGVADMVT